MNQKSFLFKFISILLTIIFVIAVIIVIKTNFQVQNIAEEEQKRDEMQNIDENTIGNYIVTINAVEERKLSPNAHITFVTYYKDCQHTIKDKEKIEDSMVNLTKEELGEIYKNWQVREFSEENVELYKETPGQCDEHYVVKENDNNISIYKIDLNNQEILMCNTGIEIKYLPEVDRNELKKGIKIIGKEELNSFLENYE